MPMRGHDDQVATSGLCCFDNRSGRVRIRNMEEFCGYPDLLRHSLSFIEHFACTYLAGCVKAINVFLRGHPHNRRRWFRYADDCHFSV
jgi:hypothetical protein